MDAAVLSSGIQTIYGCLFEADAETDALDVLRDAIGAEHVILLRLASSGISKLATCRHLSSIGQGQLDSLAASPENQAILGLLSQGRPVRTTDVVTREQMLRSTAYQHTLRAIDGGLAAYGIVRDGPDQVLAIVCRSAARGIDFDQGTLNYLKLMLPHLASVSGMARRMRLERDTARMGFSALDVLVDGIVILAPDGRLLHVNAAADALLAQGDRLRRSAATIVAADARDDEQLQRAIQAAFALGTDALLTERVVHAGRPLQVVIGRRKSLPPLVVTLLPSRATSSLGHNDRTIIMHIVDPDSANPALPDPYSLRDLFDLTLKEAALAAALASGLSLKQAAAQHGMQFGTARKHLEHIFQKTGTHQQTQLVLLLKSAQSPVSTSTGQTSAPRRSG